MTIDLSIVRYNDGRFEIIFKDSDTLEEITFSGNQALEDDEHALCERIAPACVYARYVRKC